MRASSITRWDPWQELNRLQSDVSRWLLNDRGAFRAAQTLPAINLWQNNDELLLTAEVPGVDPEDLDLTVNADSVQFKGKRSSESLEEGESVYRQERFTEEFNRTVKLPFTVDPRTADASCEKGVLTLKVARPEEHKPRSVSVKAG